MCDYNDATPEGWEKINAYEIGNIPYENIIDFDIEGDEFYNVPHVYCRFDNLGGPYESIWYHPNPEFQKIIYKLESEKRLASSVRQMLLS